VRRAAATRRTDRAQRLREAGGRLARSLTEREIVRELARQVARLLPGDVVVYLGSVGESSALVPAVRLHGSRELAPAEHPVPQALLQTVARTARALRLPWYDEADVRPGAVLVAPMLAGLQLVGIVAVHADARGTFGASDEEALLAVASQAATAVLTARLYEASERERRQSEALAEVARAVGASLRLDDVLALSLRHAAAALRSAGAWVLLRSGEYLEVVAGSGEAERLLGMVMPLHASLGGVAMREGRPVIANEASVDTRAYAPARRMVDARRIILAPLVTVQGAVGALGVFDGELPFTDADARLLQALADQVAVAVVNARLFEEVAESTREWAVAFDAIATGMVVLDAAGSIVRANQPAAELCGVSGARALVGRRLDEALLHEEPEREQSVQEAIRRGHVVRVTVRSQARGRLYQLVAAPHPAGGAVVTFSDITERHALSERYRLVVETATDAIVITGRDRRIVFANPAADRLFARPGGVVGVPALELVPSEAGDEVARREEAAFAGEPQRYETTITRPDGEVRVVAVSTAPLREAGVVTGVLASLRDVTEERRARDAVAQSEARYRNLLETAPDAIVTLDAAGAFTSANAAAAELTGEAGEALLGRPFAACLEPASRDGVTAELRRALGGERRRFECAVRRADGTSRLVTGTFTPMRHHGAVVGVLAVAQDVTAERARAAALERSEARYARLVESASDGIFTVDLEGRITSVNPALLHGIGREVTQVIGAHFSALVRPDHAASVRQLFAAMLGGDRARGEVHYADRQGEDRVASILASPIVEDGVVVGGLGVARDVTEEKRLAAQLLQREKLAAVGQLVSGVAHELNNPLAGVIAFSQLLLASPTDDPEARQAAETIDREARRAARIVSSLLTFARQHEPARALTDLNALLREVLELRRYALRMQHVDVRLDLDEALPPTWADAGQLQQVFVNLLTNAEHALTGWAGERRVTLSSRRQGDRLVLCVSDTGPGIDPTKAERVFNPFFTTKPVGQGTGLGLSLSDGILREHGGSIRAESRPGHGATFVVELPIVDAPPSPPAPRLSPRAGAPAAPRARGATRVLVVDDETAIRSAIRRFLAREGYTVEVAAGGAEAVTLLERSRYDAVLLDLRMPDLSGDAVYEAVRRRDPEQASRIIFVTGDVRSDQALRFIAGTGCASLSKPFLLEDLVRLLGETPAA
jgi:PAS domain S-box-containing protein